MASFQSRSLTDAAIYTPRAPQPMQYTDNYDPRMPQTYTNSDAHYMLTQLQSLDYELLPLKWELVDALWV